MLPSSAISFEAAVRPLPQFLAPFLVTNIVHNTQRFDATRTPFARRSPELVPPPSIPFAPIGYQTHTHQNHPSSDSIPLTVRFCSIDETPGRRWSPDSSLPTRSSAVGFSFLVVKPYDKPPAPFLRKSFSGKRVKHAVIRALSSTLERIQMYSVVPHLFPFAGQHVRDPPRRLQPSHHLYPFPVCLGVGKLVTALLRS